MKLEMIFVVVCGINLIAGDVLRGQVATTENPIQLPTALPCYTLEYKNCSTNKSNSCSTCKTLYINPGASIPVEEEHAQPGARKVLRCRSLIQTTYSGLENIPTAIPATAVGFRSMGPATFVHCNDSVNCFCHDENQVAGDACIPGNVVLPEYITSRSVNGQFCWALLEEQ